MSKVILETCYLNEKQIRDAVDIANRAGLDFVKTSTGFAPGGATEEAVRIMVDQAGGEIKVKASGGIRSREAAELFLDLGAVRLGASNADKLLCGES